MAEPPQPNPGQPPIVDPPHPGPEIIPPDPPPPRPEQRCLGRSPHRKLRRRWFPRPESPAAAPGARAHPEFARQP